MDKCKRDLLTDGLSYLQGNLTVTWAMVHRLVDEGVLTMEEGQNIWVCINVKGQYIYMIYRGMSQGQR